MKNNSSPSVVLITIDRKASSVIFTRSDGKEARFPLEYTPFEDTSTLARIDVRPTLDALLATTLRGDQVLFELPVEGLDQLADRLVVYLDQNQWSALSAAFHDDNPNAENRAVAEKLKKWVEQRQIVMPASAGHYYETSKWFDNERRYHLGLTILQHSRGWQMRDPLQVRRDELHDHLRRYIENPRAHAEPVFTLAANALHSEIRRSPSVQPAGFGTGPLAFQTEAVTEAVASIDTMLDSQPLAPGPDTGWAAFNQRFSDWLDSEQRDSQQKRKAIDLFLLSDLREDIATAAATAEMTTDQFETWMKKHATAGIAELPATGLFREMLRNRHLNKGTKWKPNDCFDMVYLSCAAGYADVVVCERHMRDPLQHGLRRTGRTTQVYRRLPEAVEAIERILEERFAHHIEPAERHPQPSRDT